MIVTKLATISRAFQLLAPVKRSLGVSARLSDRDLMNTIRTFRARDYING